MKIAREFYKFVLPSMLAFALSGVYAIADGFFVGNAMGDDALAAINIAYPITAFIQAAGAGIGMGGAILFAVHSGLDDSKQSNRYFGASLMLLIGAGALLTALFSAAGPVLAAAFGARGEILLLSSAYIRFVTYGAIFQVLGTGIVPFIRNMGSAVTAMTAMICGFLVNIVLDYLLVWVFPYGMVGAAVATVIGQSVTFLVCMVFILKNKKLPELKIDRGIWHAAKKAMIAAISPFGLTFSPNVTLILVNRSAVMYGGDAAVTCFAAISYISCVVLLLLQGVSDGGQPLISLSYGRGETDRLKSFRRIAYRFAFLVAAACAVVLFLMRGSVAALFGASAEIGRQVANALPLFLTGYLFASFSRITASYFYATENNKLASILIYGEPVCLFISLMILPEILGIWGTWVSVPLSQICMMLMGMVLIRRWGAVN